MKGIFFKFSVFSFVWPPVVNCIYINNEKVLILNLIMEISLVLLELMS